MKKRNVLFEQLNRLNTEKRNRKTMKIDQMTPRQILKTINSEDRLVISAVKKEIPQIEKAINLVVKSFHAGGRLIYIGAGTSGRLGVLDAAECPPTFGTNPSMVKAIIAGGARAMFRSQEGAEDKTQTARESLRKLNISEKDIV